MTKCKYKQVINSVNLTNLGDLRKTHLSKNWLPFAHKEFIKNQKKSQKFQKNHKKFKKIQKNSKKSQKIQNFTKKMETGHQI